MNEKSQAIKERLYSEERSSIRNHKTGNRTAEKQGNTEATGKSSKQFQILSPDP
jgi:hypothetical protein